MNKEYFEKRAIFYANWTGHSSFPRYYGVRDAFIDSLTDEEYQIMEAFGFFDKLTENGKRFDNAIRNTSGKNKVDDDFYAMYNETFFANYNADKVENISEPEPEQFGSY